MKGILLFVLVAIVEALLFMFTGPVAIYLNVAFAITLMLIIASKVSEIHSVLSKKEKSSEERELERMLLIQRKEAESSIDSRDLPQERDIVELTSEER